MTRRTNKKGKEVEVPASQCSNTHPTIQSKAIPDLLRGERSTAMLRPEGRFLTGLVLVFSEDSAPGALLEFVECCL
jgi:hypothetical protein